MKTHLVMVIVGSALLLSGCKTSPMEESWPIPPEVIVDIQPPAPKPGDPLTPIKHAQQFPDNLRKLINSAQRDRLKMDWANGDFTSLGVIAAVGGALADQAGLLNAGAGMSVLGMSASDRYKYNVQSSSYSEARIALECIIAKANTTNDDEVSWASNQPNVDTQDAAIALAPGIIAATQKVKEGLITRLQSIQNVPVNTADFKRVFEEQQAALNKLHDSEEALISQVENDRKIEAAYKQKVAAFKSLTNDEISNRSRIDSATAKVPLDRQVEVGKKLIMLLPAVNACTAGY